MVEGEGHHQTYRRITQTQVTYPSWLPAAAVDLMRCQLITRRPTDRMEASDVGEHRWLAAPQLENATAPPPQPVPAVPNAEARVSKIDAEEARLQALGRRQLQAAAKVIGIPANGKSSAIVTSLLAAWVAAHAAELDEKSAATPESVRSTCVACEDAPRETRCRPCGHALLCGTCTIRAINARRQTYECPACRAAVTTIEWRAAGVVHDKTPPTCMPTFAPPRMEGAADVQTCGVGGYLWAHAEGDDEVAAKAARTALKAWVNAWDVEAPDDSQYDDEDDDEDEEEEGSDGAYGGYTPTWSEDQANHVDYGSTAASRQSTDHLARNLFDEEGQMSPVY